MSTAVFTIGADSAARPGEARVLVLGVTAFTALVLLCAFVPAPLPVRLAAAGVAAVLCLYSWSGALLVLLSVLALPMQGVGVSGLVPLLAVLTLGKWAMLEFPRRGMAVGAAVVAALMMVWWLGAQSLRAESTAQVVQWLYPGAAVLLGLLLVNPLRLADLNQADRLFPIPVLAGFATRVLSQLGVEPEGLRSAVSAAARLDVLQKLTADQTLLTMGARLNRNLLPGEEPNYQAMQLALIACVILFLAAREGGAALRGRGHALLRAVLAGLVLWQIVGTYSRTGLAACVVIGATLLLGLRASWPTRAAIAGAGVATAVLLPGLAGGAGLRFRSLQAQLAGNLSDRADAWGNGWTVWTQNVLLGGGPGSVKATQGLSSHHTYLNYFAELGLVAGAALLVIALGVPLWRLARWGEGERQTRAALLATFVVLQFAMFTLTLEYSWFFSMWLAVLYLGLQRIGPGTAA
ncbi:MAG TPA: O-antigen ligase family protein [Caulobacteraceae bacterium]|nr:O-antigen ligase family protein [Caulobacteraceae bacterium]